MLGAFCLTEPHVGSRGRRPDARRAVRDGDDYVLNGVKQFITSGKNGDVAIVMAVTDKAAGKKGISAFIVPTDDARLRRRAASRTSSASTPATRRRSCSRTAACRPRTCSARKARAARSRCRAWRAGASASPRSRSAWRAPRSRRRCAYAKERESFGKPIFEHQAVQFRLADMATQIEAARQLILHAASAEGCRRAVPEGSGDGQAVRLARWPSASAPTRSRSTAATATSADFPVERIYRDVRVCQIYEGTSDIQKILIGRALA